MGSDRQPRIAELFSPEARAALAEWTRRPRAGSDRLGLATFLRARFAPQLARALAEQFDLRLRAATKFAQPERMILHRKGLEQATRLDVARWRAGRVKHFAPKSAVVDATCGLGADTLALLGEALPTLAIESDESTAQMAAHNIRELTEMNCVVLGSALEPPVRAQYWIVDPDRRGDGPRSLEPEAWSPPLSTVLSLARTARGACIKLAPAFDWEQFSLTDLGPGAWLPSWVSAAGELRECSLWSGEWAADAARGEREVIQLAGGTDQGHSSVRASIRALPARIEPHEPGAATEVRWFAEPDPALIRSGLLGNVALRAGARPLAAMIAYLGSMEPIDDPLLSAWPVIASCPLDPKRVRRMLTEHDVGSIEVRKRGHPDAAEVLAKRLAGSGSRHGVLAVARLERGHQAYLLGR